jgi:hypothetical protein
MTLPGQGGEVFSVSYNAKGDQIASGSELYPQVGRPDNEGGN